MKKMILILAVVALLSAFVVPTFSYYTIDKGEIGSNGFYSNKQLDVENLVAFLTENLDNPELNALKSNNISWWNKNLEYKHEIYSIYSYLFVVNKGKASTSLDSTGYNYGMCATQKILNYSLPCTSKSTLSWRLYLKAINGNTSQVELLWYITTTDISLLSVGNIVPHVMRISGIILNKADGTVDETSNPVAVCGTMAVKVGSTITDKYNPETNKLDKITYSINILDGSSFEQTSCTAHTYSQTSNE